MQTIIICLLFLFFKGAYFQDDKLSLANNKLGFDLYKSFPKKINLFFSPISVSAAMGMIYVGARQNTEAEMRTTLGYEYAQLDASEVPEKFKQYLTSIDSSSSDYTLDMANGGAVQQDFSIEKTFETILRDNFKVTLKMVDFVTNSSGVTKEINTWVENRTKGKITKLVDKDLSTDTKLVILNAVYFKGNWLKMFDSKLTKPTSFMNNGDPSQSKMVQMMTIMDYFLFCNNEKFIALQLPYKGNDMHMLIVLPNKVDGLEEIENNFNSQLFTDILKALSNDTISVQLPKFNIEYFRDLNDDLTNLGMKSSFSSSANFSGISQQLGIYISHVLHKSFIEVNEEGSVAAATTGVIMTKTSIMRPDFRADHPFMFFIYNSNNNIILFSGRIVQF